MRASSSFSSFADMFVRRLPLVYCILSESQSRGHGWPAKARRLNRKSENKEAIVYRGCFRNGERGGTPPFLAILFKRLKKMPRRFPLHRRTQLRFAELRSSVQVLCIRACHPNYRFVMFCYQHVVSRFSFGDNRGEFLFELIYRHGFHVGIVHKCVPKYQAPFPMREQCLSVSASESGSQSAFMLRLKDR
jgi:hypothetical protein